MAMVDRNGLVADVLPVGGHCEGFEKGHHLFYGYDRPGKRPVRCRCGFTEAEALADAFQRMRVIQEHKDMGWT